MIDQISPTMGNILCTLRKGHGMTQEQLAEQLGLSFQAISKWENGASYPDLLLLPKIADLFGVNIDELFGREKLPGQHLAGSLPWADDGKLRAVLYIGQRLVMENTKDQSVFTFVYDGEALNVDSHFSITCNNIGNNAHAGASITCASIGNNANAGTDISCANIGNNASAGADISAANVGGNAIAGTAITCLDVGADVHAQQLVNCANVDGHVECHGNITCGMVREYVECHGDVSCGNVGDYVKAEGNVTCVEVSGNVIAQGQVVREKHPHGQNAQNT